MTVFYAVYRNELSKLFRRKKYIAFLVIGILICIVWAGLGNMASGMLGQNARVFIALTPTPMGVLPFFLQLFIPLLIFMGMTDLITSESAEHTMKSMICRPVERWKLYAGKHLAMITYTTIYLACVFIVSLVLSQMFGEAIGLSNFFTALLSYALTIVPLAVLTSFAALVSLFGRSSTLTMFLLVAMYLVMTVLPIVFPIFAELLFTSYLGWHRFWIGALPAASRLIHMLIIVVGYGAVFFIGGSLIFDRKEY